MALPLVEPAEQLTIDEVRRYSRHLIIPDRDGWSEAAEECAGVGHRCRWTGQSGPVVPGCGRSRHPWHRRIRHRRRIELAAPDHSRAVRHRQVEGAVGQESIAETNPFVRVVVHDTRLDNDNVMEIFGQYDLIIDGTDNFATRYLVNDACVLLGKPYVWGSIYRFDGQVSVFWAEHGPCYRCLYPEPPPPGMVPSCAEAGCSACCAHRSARPRSPRRSSC